MDYTVTLHESGFVMLPPAIYNRDLQKAAAPAIADRDTARAQLATANDRIQQLERDASTLTKQLESKDDLLAAANRSIIGLQLTNKQQSDMLKDAQAKLAKYEPGTSLPSVIPAPPVVVPGEVKQRPWIPFVGAYFEDERAVDDTLDANDRAAVLIPAMQYTAANSLIRDFIVFLNPEELKNGLLLSAVKSLKARWWQSPVQNDFVPGAADQSEFIARLDALHKAGMYGCFVDDAQNIPFNHMPVLLDLIRDHCPGAPVVCSFAADFDDSAYPKSRYIDSRQWFLKNVESEGVWFQRWETAQDAQIYTADCWRRDGGFMHTPARIESMIKTALPFVQGLVFYSLVNVGKWNHIEDHRKAIAANPKAKTVWSVMAAGAAEYMKLNQIVAQAD